MMNILSWNVNGIRAVSGKGFFDWLKIQSADVVCLQETKAKPVQLTKEFFEATDSSGLVYKTVFASAARPGYSGVAIYSRKDPLATRLLGIDEFDGEGRYLEADFGPLVVVSAYYPNSQDAGARIDYKLRFCEAVLARADVLVKQKRQILICGDYNIAHTPIDLSHPKANEANPGYLPQEREFMTRFLAAGYVDTFREAHKDEPKHYSWWSYRMRAREKNVGWRLDYHCVNEALRPAIAATGIQSEVMGSDHCPVSISLDL